MRLPRTVFAASVILLVACASEPATFADDCTAVGSAICTRLDACGMSLGTTCVEDYAAYCVWAHGDNAQAESLIPAELVEGCITLIEGVDCYERVLPGFSTACEMAKL